MEASTRFGEDDINSPNMRSIGDTDVLSPGGNIHYMQAQVNS